MNILSLLLIINYVFIFWSHKYFVFQIVSEGLQRRYIGALVSILTKLAKLQCYNCGIRIMHATCLNEWDQLEGALSLEMSKKKWKEITDYISMKWRHLKEAQWHKNHSFQESWTFTFLDCRFLVGESQSLSSQTLKFKAFPYFTSTTLCHAVS